MSTETKEVAKTQKQTIVVQDNSEFSALLDTGRFEQMWRIAGIFSSSQLVPTHFQGEQGRSNCFLGLQMAFRLGVDPMMLLQNTYIVGSRPGMESKMIIALINSSGLFADPLDYEVVGASPNDPNYKVRAFAERKGSGKMCYGPWIDWAMVKAEKWNEKPGSKWRTIPSQMFMYRAAAFFGRLYCPERLLGMQTAEELIDITPTTETATPTDAKKVMDRFKKQPAVEVKPEPVTEPVNITDPAELPITSEEIAEVIDSVTDTPPAGNSALHQNFYTKLAELAELRGESPDDLIDTLTKGKVSCQVYIEDKPDGFVNDLLMTIISEISKGA